MDFFLCGLFLLSVTGVLSMPPARMRCTQHHVNTCLNRPPPPSWPEEAPPIDCRFVQCFSGCANDDEARDNLDEATFIRYQNLMSQVQDGVCPAGPVCEDWFVDVCKMYMRSSPMGRNPCAMLFCYRPCMADPSGLNTEHQATFAKIMKRCGSRLP